MFFSTSATIPTDRLFIHRLPEYDFLPRHRHQSDQVEIDFPVQYERGLPLRYEKLFDYQEGGIS